MKLAVGSDERTNLTDAVIANLKERGHEVVLFGPLAGKEEYWPAVAQQAGVQYRGPDARCAAGDRGRLVNLDGHPAFGQMAGHGGAADAGAVHVYLAGLLDAGARSSSSGST